MQGKELKRKSVRGGVVTMAAQGGSIAVQIASTVVLSRLLPAEDFGIIAMIVAVTAFAGLFRDMGLSTASIQKVNLTFAQTNALFWINVATGAFLTLLVAACAPLVAKFYGRAELLPVTMLLSSTFLLASLGAQHAALMQRELRFKPKAFSDISGAIVSLLASITLAANGYGYWSLAWGTVAGVSTTTLLYFALSSFRPGLPRRAEGVKELIGFGVNVTAFEFVNYFHRNLDNVLIGRVWGAGALGLYSRAYQLMMLPIISIRTPINAVALPVLSRLQAEPDQFRRYYRQITAVLGVLSIPLMAFLTVNAEGVIRVALGDGWSEMVPIFVLLGLTGLIQPAASLRGLVLLSLGKTKRYLIWGVLNAVAVSVGFAIGVIWGSVGVAASYAITNYLILYPSLVFAFNETPVRPSDFFEALMRPSLSAAIASGVNMYAIPFVSPFGDFLSIFLAFIVFSLAFLVVFCLVPGGVGELKAYGRLVREIRGNKENGKLR